MMAPVTRATTAEELTAVAGVAAELGIGPIKPVVLSLAKHSIIRLAPLPLVARLRSAGGIAQARTDLARELGVASYLAARNAPVIRPARSIDPGPHVSGRCAMTIWEFTPHRAAASDADAWLAARALQRFHAAFAPFDNALPLFTEPIDACGDLISTRDRIPALEEENRQFLSMLYARLREAMTGYSYRSMPIHGDAHLANALLTETGAVWGDFEAVCLGPVEWDIASLPENTWPAFVGIRSDLTRCLADMKSLCVVIWCRTDHGRSPAMDEAAIIIFAFSRTVLAPADPVLIERDAWFCPQMSPLCRGVSIRYS